MTKYNKVYGAEGDGHSYSNKGIIRTHEVRGAEAIGGAVLWLGAFAGLLLFGWFSTLDRHWPPDLGDFIYLSIPGFFIYLIYKFVAGKW